MTLYYLLCIIIFQYLNIAFVRLYITTYLRTLIIIPHSYFLISLLS
jgi:hypothetical protein